MSATTTRGTAPDGARPARRHARALTALLAGASLPLLLGACHDASAPAEPPSAPSLRYAAASVASSDVIPDEYIVVFRDSVRDVAASARSLAAAHGATVRFTYTSAIKGFAAHIPAAAVDALSRNPSVAYVEPDKGVRASDVESPLRTWGLDRIDQHLSPLDNSYSYATKGSGVSVYILDSGIRTTHQEFGGRAMGAYTAINDGNGAGDCNGHGTHVAGTVGGTQFGVAKDVRLYSVRILDCSGHGTSSGLIAGVDWVTRNRVLPAIANMSLEGATSSSLNSAVASSIQAGVVYAVAAGNDAGNACNYSPASVADALTVGAISTADNMAGFSNFGSCVDLFAPGATIRSASSVDDTSSVLMSGTSMATPHVAGVAALYLSANPSASPAQVNSAIIGGATANVISGIPAGTPNLLLYSALAGGTPSIPPTIDTTTILVPPPTTDTSTTQAPTPSPVTDQPPVASFTSNCSRGRCRFDASSSSDDNGIVAYSWNFGDGSAAVAGPSLAKIVYTYSSAGSYTVTLTVTDALGQQSSKSLTVSIRKV